MIVRNRLLAIMLALGATVGAGAIQYRTAYAGRPPTDAEIRSRLVPAVVDGPLVDLPADGKPVRLHLRKRADGQLEFVVVDKLPRGALEIGRYEVEVGPANTSWIRPRSQTTFARYPEGAPELTTSLRVQAIERVDE